MRNEFVEKFSKIIPEYSNYRYVIGVSGGMDSMVLWDLMGRWLPREQLVVAHFNHKTRGQESEADAEFVKHQALKLGHTFELGKRMGTQVSELALREERLGFLKKVKEAHGCDYIVLGHHLQDQLETFLMRLIRGTGLDGLAVMELKNGVWLRPLLTFSKETLSEYAKDSEISFREDSSNHETRYFRNDIRQNLLPELERLSKKYGGKEIWLSRLKDLFHEINVVKKELNRETKNRISPHWVKTPFWLRIPRDLIENLSSLERRRGLRLIVSSLEIETLSYAELTRWEEAVLERKQNISIRGLEMNSSCGFLFFRPFQAHRSEISLSLFQNSHQVQCETLGLVLDVDPQLSPLEWRQVRPGDRFFGKKVKEYFLEKRIPKWERGLIPVAAPKGSPQLTWVLSEPHEAIRIKKLEFPFSFRNRSVLF
jgi:tRNA(Ile)-lysidine synthetase-like protein